MSRRKLELPELVMPAQVAVDDRLGPEPVSGWHRGIPGLRKRTPAEQAAWLATGGRPTALRYLPEFTEQDEDSFVGYAGPMAETPLLDQDDLS